MSSHLPRKPHFNVYRTKHFQEKVVSTKMCAYTRNSPVYPNNTQTDTNEILKFHLYQISLVHQLQHADMILKISFLEIFILYEA